MKFAPTTPRIASLEVSTRPEKKTSVTDFELRAPREAFARKLEQICNRVDETPEVEVEFLPHLYSTEKRRARVRLKRLWVAGSFARGAETCGDLDLIYQCDAHVLNSDSHANPEGKEVSKALMGSLPDVRFYAGTPEENTSHVRMDDAVLIWSGPGCNWREALGRIKVDPDAGPAPRKILSLPFRLEQFHRGVEEVDHLEDLLDARDQGLVEWEFIPFDEQLLAPIVDARLAGHLERLAWSLEGLGKARSRLAPPILRLIHERYAGTSAILQTVGSQSFDYGNTQVRIGSIYVRPTCIASLIPRSEVVLVPERSRRGPNGAWVVRRGPRHPLTMLLSNLRFWASSSRLGVGLRKKNGREPWMPRISELSLFSGESPTRGLSAHARGDTVALSGPALLGALGSADRVVLSREGIVLEHRELCLDDENSPGWKLVDAGLAHLVGTEEYVVTQDLRRKVREANDTARISQDHFHRAREAGRL